MIHRVPQPPAATLHAPHIEKSDRQFRVRWDAPAYFNVLYFQASPREATVLAETPEGALRIAQYHHFRGRNFELVDSPA